MRKYITLFFSVSLLLSACKSNKTPEGIINHDRMINLLTEVHIIDGRMYNVKQEPDSLYKFGFGRYKALFKKYDTDSGQFRKSVKYYTTQPTELQAMYDQILINLKRMSDSLNKANQKRYNAVPKH